MHVVWILSCAVLIAAVTIGIVYILSSGGPPSGNEHHDGGMGGM